MKLLLTMASIFLITLSVFLLQPGISIAHPGPTDSKGCHYDNNGRYHCH